MLSGAKETRTPDPLHAMQVLYQLSYGPMNAGDAAWLVPSSYLILHRPKNIKPDAKPRPASLALVPDRLEARSAHRPD